MTLELEAKPARARKDIHKPLDAPVHLTNEAGTEPSLTSHSEVQSADALDELAARGRKGLEDFTRTEVCPACEQDILVLPDGNLANHVWKDDPALKCGGPDIARLPERTIDVTAYGPDGESIVVTQAIPFYEVKDGEVVNPPRAAGDWSASAPVVKITLPGFDAPIDVDIVKLNFTGNIELDIVGEEHRAIWNALRWKGMTTLIVQAKVRDLALQERTGDRAQATLKILSVTRYTDARNPYEGGESSKDQIICDRCGEELAIDGLYCGACIAAMDAEDAEDTAATVETEPGTQLDQALAEALAVVGEDDEQAHE